MLHLDEEREAVLLAVASRVVPGIADLDTEECDRFLEIVDTALGDRPEPLRRQLRLFLTVIDRAPVLRWGRTFRRLDGPSRDRLLRWLQDGPVPAVRSGFWGLKSLIFMGYYARPEVGPQIGYEPSFDGNARLRQGAG